jgi:hypothetical protein
MYDFGFGPERLTQPRQIAPRIRFLAFSATALTMAVEFARSSRGVVRLYDVVRTLWVGHGTVQFIDIRLCGDVSLLGSAKIMSNSFDRVSTLFKNVTVRAFYARQLRLGLLGGRIKRAKRNGRNDCPGPAALRHGTILASGHRSGH